MGITFKTAATHRNNLLAKFQASNTAEMMMRAVALDLLSPVRHGDPPDGATQGRLAEELRQKMGQLMQENRRNREALSAELAESRTLVRISSETRKEFREALTEIRGNVHLLSLSMKDPAPPLD